MDGAPEPELGRPGWTWAQALATLAVGLLLVVVGGLLGSGVALVRLGSPEVGAGFTEGALLGLKTAYAWFCLKVATRCISPFVRLVLNPADPKAAESLVAMLEPGWLLGGQSQTGGL